jgi:hypothetical protein
MTAKRFTSDGLWIEDNVRQHSFHVTIENNVYALTDLLNILAEENEQLRKENQTLIQGIQDTAKQGAETIIKLWESKHQPKTIKRGYYD